MLSNFVPHPIRRTGKCLGYKDWGSNAKTGEERGIQRIALPGTDANVLEAKGYRQADDDSGLRGPRGRTLKSGSHTTTAITVDGLRLC
jgi:hypothetical protein